MLSSLSMELILATAIMILACRGSIFNNTEVKLYRGQAISIGTFFKCRHAAFVQDVFSGFVSIFIVVHPILKRPKRIVPRFYTESRLFFRVSSHLNPIGDRNDV